MKITVGKFQELYRVNGTNLNETDKAVLMVQILTGKSEDQVRKMKAWRFNILVDRILKSFKTFNERIRVSKPMETAKVNGHWYRFNLDIRKTDAGRYVEVASFSEDIIGNLHKILASMAIPMRVTWRGLRPKPYDAQHHEAIAEDMRDLPFEQAFHCALFFWAVFDKLMKDSDTYLSLIPQEKREEADSWLKTLASYSDGSITASWWQTLKT